jgi:aryl-alcohol dehydrogenase-like predicted oxidoreductase
MPLDHFVTLGRSGLRVSPFCLGTMTFGEDLGWGSSVEVSTKILDRYLERGGNFLDTANLYTKGHSEKIIGDHLAKTEGKRDRLVIATKFSGNHFPGDPNGGGSSRKAILAACEQSLRRLRTDYIDLYWLHVWDKHTPIDETMSALNDLVHAGKVRYIGVSDTPAWKITEAQLTAMHRGLTQFVALQVEYSLLERTVEGEHIPMAQGLGMGVTPWSPLKGGILTGRYTRANKGKEEPSKRAWVSSNLSDTAYDVIEELTATAKALDTTVSRVALAWVQARPGVTSTILGASSLAQLDDNLAAIDLRLSPEQTRKLDALTKPKLNFPADFAGFAPMIYSGGTTINGEPSQASPFGVTKFGEHY